MNRRVEGAVALDLRSQPYIDNIICNEVIAY
jgi:hypothetical protein